MFLYSTYSMKLATISMATVTMCGSKLIKDWQVHNLLVNVAKLRENDFNITGTQFPSYENGLHQGDFFQKAKGVAELVNGSLPYRFYVICILQSQSDGAIIVLLRPK